MKIQRFIVDPFTAELSPHESGYVYRCEDVQPFLEPRPISEAPKDGEVLLWASLYGSAFGWVIGRFWESVGWTASALPVTATHWLPLPLPPVGEQG